MFVKQKKVGSFRREINFGKFEPKISRRVKKMIIDASLPPSSIRMAIKRTLDKAALEGIVRPSIKVISSDDKVLDDVFNHLTKNLKEFVGNVEMVLVEPECLFKESKKNGADLIIILATKTEFEASRIKFINWLDAIDTSMKDLKGKLLKALREKNRVAITSLLKKVEDFKVFVTQKGLNEEAVAVGKEIKFFETVAKARLFLQQ